MEHGNRFHWGPQMWWALGQWPIWLTGKAGADYNTLTVYNRAWLSRGVAMMGD